MGDISGGVLKDVINAMMAKMEIMEQRMQQMMAAMNINEKNI
jgi:hypothetical protein